MQIVLLSADGGPVTGSSGPIKTLKEYSIADGGASELSTISAGIWCALLSPIWAF